MKRVLIACGVAALMLSGCVTDEELAAQDDNTCHSYGAPTGSNAYFECRMIKDQQHAEQRERAMERLHYDLEKMGAAIDGRS